MKFKQFYSTSAPFSGAKEISSCDLLYDGSIKCFSKDEFNLAVSNMFIYPAKIAHLELVGDKWILYKSMPESHTAVPLYYVKGASKEQQDFIDGCWFTDQKSSVKLRIRFD